MSGEAEEALGGKDLPKVAQLEGGRGRTGLGLSPSVLSILPCVVDTGMCHPDALSRKDTLPQLQRAASVRALIQ